MPNLIRVGLGQKHIDQDKGELAPYDKRDMQTWDWETLSHTLTTLKEL